MYRYRVGVVTSGTIAAAATIVLQNTVLQIMYGRPAPDFDRPLYKVTLSDNRSGRLINDALVADIRNIIRKKKYGEIKKLLRKEVRDLPNFFGWLEEEILPQLHAKYKNALAEYFRHKEEKVRERAEQYRAELEAIIQKPLYYLLKYVNSYEHVGDETLLMGLALTCSSLLLPRGNRLSTFVGGESGSGKNHAVKSVLQLFPREWFLYGDRYGITRFTPHALEYLPTEKLDYIIYVQEAVGKEEGNYTFRVVKSENKLVLFVPVRDENGNITTQRKEIPGDPVIITTSTSFVVNPEDRTRTLYAEVDMSGEQTERVLDFEGMADSMHHIDFLAKYLIEKERWVNSFIVFFKILKRNVEKAGIEAILTNLTKDEFKLLIKKIFPLLRVSVRREAGHIKNLAKASAILHYEFREVREVELDGGSRVKALVVGWQDWLNAIIAALPSIHEEYGLGASEEEALHQIIDNTERVGYGDIAGEREKRVYSEFTANDLAKWLNVTPRHARNILERLLAKGFVELVSEKTRPKKWRFKGVIEEIPRLNSNSIVGYAIKILENIVDSRAKKGVEYIRCKLYDPLTGEEIVLKPSLPPEEYLYYYIERNGSSISVAQLKHMCESLGIDYKDFIRDGLKNGKLLLDQQDTVLLIGKKTEINGNLPISEKVRGEEK